MPQHEFPIQLGVVYSVRQLDLLARFETVLLNWRCPNIYFGQALGGSAEIFDLL